MFFLLKGGGGGGGGGGAVRGCIKIDTERYSNSNIIYIQTCDKVKLIFSEDMQRGSSLNCVHDFIPKLVASGKRSSEWYVELGLPGNKSLLTIC